MHLNECESNAHTNTIHIKWVELDWSMTMTMPMSVLPSKKKNNKWYLTFAIKSDVQSKKNKKRILHKLYECFWNNRKKICQMFCDYQNCIRFNSTHENGFFSSPHLLDLQFNLFGSHLFMILFDFFFFNLIIWKLFEHKKCLLFCLPICLMRSWNDYNKNAYIDMNFFVNIVHFENDVFSSSQRHVRGNFHCLKLMKMENNCNVFFSFWIYLNECRKCNQQLFALDKYACKFIVNWIVCKTNVYLNMYPSTGFELTFRF